MNIQVDENQQKQIHKNENTQKELNAPISDPTGTSKSDDEFFKTILKMIDDGKIDLYKPETLLNKSVYDKLAENIQGKVDLEALNLLTSIRQIKDLTEAGFADSYQIQNQLESFRHTKQRIENESGDVFII